MADTWERANGFDFYNSADAGLDFDGDGVINRLEFLALTNPKSSIEYLRPGAVSLSGGNLGLTFHSLSPLRNYQLESTSLLMLPTIWNLAGAPFSAPGGTVTLNVPFNPAAPRAFYRLRVDYDF